MADEARRKALHMNDDGEAMIRPYQHDDHIAIAAIFTSAIHEIASKDYTPEQCLAWSDREPNYEHWRKRCELKRPFVAVIDSEVAGFLEVGTCFSMNVLRVYVEASTTAKPLFEKLGFRVIRQNIVTIKGVELMNYSMELLKET